MRVWLCALTFAVVLPGCADREVPLTVTDDQLSPRDLDLSTGTLEIRVDEDVKHDHVLVYSRHGTARVQRMLGGEPLEPGTVIELEIGFGDFQIWCENHGTATSGMTMQVSLS